MVLPSTSSSATATRHSNPARQDRTDSSMTRQRRRKALLASCVTVFFLVVNFSLTTYMTAKYKKIRESEEATSALFSPSEDKPEKESEEISQDLLLRGEVDFCWIVFCVTQPLGVLAIVFQLQCLHGGQA